MISVASLLLTKGATSGSGLERTPSCFVGFDMLRTISRCKRCQRERRNEINEGGKEYLTLDLSNHITVVALFECYSEVVDSGILFSLPFFCRH